MSCNWEYHRAQLCRRCRVCAKLLNKEAIKNSSLCTDNTDILEKGFQINIGNDDPQIHAPLLCNTCRTKGNQYSDSKGIDSAMKVYGWAPHTQECSQCNFSRSQGQGGRPPKVRKNRGRPMSKSSKGIAGEVRRNAPVRWRASLPLSPEHFLPPGGTVSLADLQCSLCKCIVDGPVQTPCRYAHSVLLQSYSNQSFQK